MLLNRIFGGGKLKLTLGMVQMSKNVVYNKESFEKRRQQGKLLIGCGFLSEKVVP